MADEEYIDRRLEHMAEEALVKARKAMTQIGGEFAKAGGYGSRQNVAEDQQNRPRAAYPPAPQPKREWSPRPELGLTSGNLRDRSKR